MVVIPVIDIKGGQCVHAIGGHRSQYRPLTSKIVSSVGAPAVAAAMMQAVKASALYVADLDGISDGHIQWKQLESLWPIPAALWVDVGVRRDNFPQVIGRLEKQPFTKVILGTETLDQEQLVSCSLERLGSDRVVISLDLNNGKVICASRGRQDVSPVAMTNGFVEAGVSQLIVLDVAAVGTKQGCPTLSLVAEIKRRHPELFIVSGGGVADSHDLRRLADAGCDAALVSTGVHQGTLSL